MPKVQNRKHVAIETRWDDHCLPKGNHTIVKVVRYEGNNLHQVMTPTGKKYLVSMPKKFIEYTWVKRGTFVLVQAIPKGVKVRGEVIKVMDECSIKFYMENNVWPKEFEVKKIKNVAADDKLLANNNMIQPAISDNLLFLLRAVDTKKKFFWNQDQKDLK